MTLAEQLILNLELIEQRRPRKTKRGRAISAPLPDPVVQDLMEATPKMAAAPITEDQPLPPPFGEWLLQQKLRKGWIGELAKGMKLDAAFPKRGSPDDVRSRLRDMGADGDAFEALDDAELSWLAA